MMTWRIAVRHRTVLEYESEVLASFNEARMVPLSNEHQLLVQHRTSISPTAHLLSFTDYWGTSVEAFDLQAPHTSLEVVSESVVETSPRRRQTTDPSWAEFLNEKLRDANCEYLLHTDLADPIPEAANIAMRFSEATSPRLAVDAVVDFVRARLAYSAGVTNVSTTAQEAWESGRGVCQDFTHVTLSLLRSLSIPCRYVSGYHYTGSGVVNEGVVGESHAWVEAWVGYWYPVDPTNGNEVGERHIVVATGRDYHDVSPLRGIFSGGLGRSVDVQVTLTRLPR
jgi:transglutaminase-like putative cysteine protease